MIRKPIVVVGAGLGGLAAALRLSHHGEQVIVLEKTDRIGGRDRPVAVGDCQFDGGPTLMMMLDPFRKLFEDVGERMEDHLTLRLCEPSYRVFYADGSRIETTARPEAMRERIERMLGPGNALAGAEGGVYERLLQDLKAMYRDAIPAFVRKNYDSPLDFFGPRQLALVARHKMLAKLGARVERYFADPRLRMLFSFQTLYLGLSPYQAPWVYGVLAYMEYGEGIWYPEGGVVRIAEAIAELAAGKGAEIRTHAEVEAIAGGQVTLKSGEIIQAKAVAINADLPYARRELLKEARARKKLRHSCSAFMMYADYEGSLPELAHHNVVFSADFARNLEQVFERPELPDDPSFYASISARADPQKAPAGHENLYLLVPCPNLRRPWGESDARALQEVVFERLRQEVGFDAARVSALKTYTPLDWRDDLNLDLGAAFGLSHDFLQSAYFRPSNKSRQSPGVYFVGASTVPGNGMPMVLISAELLERRLLADGVIG